MSGAQDTVYVHSPDQSMMGNPMMNNAETSFDLDGYLTQVTETLAERGSASEEVQGLLENVPRESEAFRLGTMAVQLRRAYELERGRAPAPLEIHSSGSRRSLARFPGFSPPKFGVGFLFTAVLILAIVGIAWSYFSSQPRSAPSEPEVARALEKEAAKIENLEQQLAEATRKLSVVEKLVQSSEDVTKKAAADIKNAIARGDEKLTRHFSSLASDRQFAERIADAVVSRLRQVPSDSKSEAP